MIGLSVTVMGKTVTGEEILQKISNIEKVEKEEQKHERGSKKEEQRTKKEQEHERKARTMSMATETFCQPFDVYRRWRKCSHWNEGVNPNIQYI